MRSKLDYQYRSPCPMIEKVLFRNNKWILIDKMGEEEVYEEAAIIIHNPLFQLLRFSRTKESNFLVVFNDQLTKPQLQLLHLTNKTKVQ